MSADATNRDSLDKLQAAGLRGLSPSLWQAMLAADCGVTAETEEIDTVKDALVAFCEKRAASEVEGVTLSRDDWIEVASSCLSHNFAASLSVAGFVDFMLTTAAREAQAKAELEAQIADKDAEIADKDAEIADKDAEIAELKAVSQVSPTSRLEVPYLKPVRAKHFAGVVPTGSRWVASPELLLAPMLMGEVVMGVLSLGTSGTASLEVQHLDDIPDAWTGFVASGLRKANTIGSTVVCHELIKATLPLFRGLSNNHKVQSFYRGSVGVAALESSLTHRVCEGLGHVFANQQGTRAGFHSSSSQSTFSVASPAKTNPSHTDRARAKRTANSSSRSHEPQTSGLYSSAARMNIGREIAVSHGQGWDGVRPVDTQLSTKVDVLFTFEENEMVLPLGLWEPGFDPKSAQCPITMHKRKQAYGYAHNLTRASAGFPHTMALVALRSEYPTRANKALQVRTKMAVDGYVLQAEKCRALKAKATDDEPVEHTELVLDCVELVRALEAPAELEDDEKFDWFMRKVSQFSLAMFAAAHVASERHAVGGDGGDGVKNVSKVLSTEGKMVYKAFDGSKTRSINEHLWRKYASDVFVTGLYQAVVDDETEEATTDMGMAYLVGRAKAAAQGAGASREALPSDRDELLASLENLISEQQGTDSDIWAMQAACDDLRAAANSGGMPGKRVLGSDGRWYREYGLVMRLVPAVADVTVAHFVSLFKTLQCMDNDGVAHLDIRDANLVFGADGKTHIIDWDLAGVSGEAVYPVGFNWVTDGMRVESVMDAVAKNETPTGYAWHDVVGAGGVMKLYSCDSKDNRTVWKKVTETLVNVDDASSARSALAVAIEELSSKENVRLWCLGREKTVLATDSPPLSPDGSPARAAVGSSSAESSPAGSSST
ncbi:uncharacterized protein AMSG_03952 [Thecamonas trahens ATCC 50062]|uniref:Protein kinase domain-containing protein n=1 Tax=Thecamonas trahens ATCC 50062 TaxID=461836 RepID=A0A0L0D8V5_THETB|nr:hypothetical protein AMSG_03952 [Thecamonas trahens ATCC 50062]KNC47723.1 hypothetical protein AMSG_03952 [Thecamonas trahens ATCC 50062]|eukprot:XP_013759203.1 hypothetical protein AMSG_03952 [Thecamonas trahens ATCC 50062]